MNLFGIRKKIHWEKIYQIQQTQLFRASRSCKKTTKTKTFFYKDEGLQLHALLKIIILKVFFSQFDDACRAASFVRHLAGLIFIAGTTSRLWRKCKLLTAWKVSQCKSPWSVQMWENLRGQSECGEMSVVSPNVGKCLWSVQMRENEDHKKLCFGLFARSVHFNLNPFAPNARFLYTLIDVFRG